MSEFKDFFGDGPEKKTRKKTLEEKMDVPVPKISGLKRMVEEKRRLAENAKKALVDALKKDVVEEEIVEEEEVSTEEPKQTEWDSYF